MKPTSNKYRPPHTNHRNRRDTVQAYLNEIGQIPILSPREEIALIKRAQQGNKGNRSLEKLRRSKQITNPLREYL